MSEGENEVENYNDLDDTSDIVKYYIVEYYIVEYHIVHNQYCYNNYTTGYHSNNNHYLCSPNLYSLTRRPLSSPPHLRKQHPLATFNPLH
ncbi:hypothetical protein DOTSEDRAFT_43927 [Dothistroma septosporum NZE10]|uniref:Uncharacterized protein n=1 Tax=Dothistroma septosporum (strain NZE10 / CBS 128990) TaxID=675120 RepID=N1PQI0_DOTSN|nr:hypothetical protein DOTSEDRAFT_43927 [Dothistroma septosporum NZE10]